MSALETLNTEICRSFRDAINESPTISEEMPDLYNLSCAVMDRLDTAVAYLNSNWEYPKTEEAWGLKMADSFYKEFAHKWVTIDAYNMEYTEIKLLVIVALFKECKEQGRLNFR